MKQAQILSYGVQGRLAELLQEVTQPHGVWVREVSHAQTCKSLLRTGGVSVLVLRVGRDLEKEMALLEEVTRLFPDVKALVVSELDHPNIVGLAWDLGASYVLMPPQTLEQLPELVLKMLAAS